jgi:hypothetical protein
MDQMDADDLKNFEENFNRRCSRSVEACLVTDDDDDEEDDDDYYYYYYIHHDFHS